MGLSPPRTFEVVKSGNRNEECEDALRYSYPISREPARIALCDGASESAFAREWAQILSRSFVDRHLDLSDLDSASLGLWLEPAFEEWNRVVPWERIPWHGEAKSRAGAMAAFLGMVVSQNRGPSGAYPWQSVAVGDCCLFVVRDDDIAVSFPLEESLQFTNTPPLICSNPANNAGLWPQVRRCQGECLPGDLIILASDALACWVLQERESGGKPWQTLRSLQVSQREGWVQARRRERAIRNDDATLITVLVE